MLAMNEQLNPFSNAMDTFHNLCTLTLSGSHELMSWQIDSAEAFISLGTRQLQQRWSNANAMQEPEQWSEAVQLGFRNAIQMTREWVMVTSDCQMDGLHLMQKHAAEARKLLFDALSEQSPGIKLVRGGVKRNGKATAVGAHEHAA
jgi:hypothetical protein